MGWTRVDMMDPPGPLWLMVDAPSREPAGDSRRIVPVGWPTSDDYTGQLVHLISDYAKGEIRAYVLIAGDLYHRFPAKDPWPEMDVLACAALGVPVPERMADARALAESLATVRLVPSPDGLAFEVSTPRVTPENAAQLDLLDHVLDLIVGRRHADGEGT